MEIIQKDLYLYQIELEIKNKKQFILKKKKEIEANIKENIFLDEVKNDYLAYYNFIMNENKQQQAAMKKLNDYIQFLIEHEHVVNNEVKTAKHDQKDILLEIDKIKEKLNELIK